MKTSKFGRKIHGDNAKLKKGLKRHGWGLHVGTWKMGGWGLIAPEMLHVSVGDRFQGSCLEAHVSWCAISNGQNEHLATIETRHVYVPVCSGPRYPSWKPPVLGRLEANDTFTICHGNNVWSNIFLFWVLGQFWV
jgi:hypothetical protein